MGFPLTTGDLSSWTRHPVGVRHMSSFNSRLAYHISELHSQRYKLASKLGNQLDDPTVDHLSAIDVALDITRGEFSTAADV